MLTNDNNMVMIVAVTVHSWALEVVGLIVQSQASSLSLFPAFMLTYPDSSFIFTYKHESFIDFLI